MSSLRTQDERLASNDRPSNTRVPSRSPHPYHRIGQKRPSHLSPTDHTHSSPSHWARTSSESGTEADDEGTGILRGLPAPPLRPRKGLRAGRRGSEDYGTAFPVLSRWPSFGRSSSQSSRRSSGEERGRDTVEERERLKRKRYVEVLRRVSETGLLMSVGAVVLLREDARSLVWDWRKGMWCHYIGGSNALVLGLWNGTDGQ